MIKRLSVVIALGVVLSLSACGNTDKAVNEPTEAEKVTEAIESTPEVTEEPETATEEVEELPVIYADDKEINLYLNRYNEANVGQEITADQIEPYYHHGSTHKDQVKFVNKDISITGNFTGVSVYFECDTQEEYKELFIKFAKGYNAELADDTLENYWDQIVSSDVNITTTFDEFSVDAYKFGDKIDYIKIFGYLE